MRRLLIVVLSVLLGNHASAAPASGLVGALEAPGLWQAYKQSFITPGGRVMDNGNGGISHSEGQGYGMLLAVAADDQATFEQLWNWTRSQLMLRDDGLAAWRWDPAATPHVADRNNASDGDILIAWALTEAGEAWSQSAYKTAGLQMIRAIAQNDIGESPSGPVLKPGAVGFSAKDRPDGPVVNLSYWIFPALTRFAAIVPDQPFGAVIETGLKLAATARFGPQQLPSDWLSISVDTPSLAKGFPPTFGYDAIRIPLYLIWGGHRDDKLLAPYGMLFADPAMLPNRVDLAAGKTLEPLSDSGYRAIAALTRCAVKGKSIPADLRGPDVDRYYPTTLRALVLVAVHRSAPQCS